MEPVTVIGEPDVGVNVIVNFTVSGPSNAVPVTVMVKLVHSGLTVAVRMTCAMGWRCARGKKHACKT